MPTKEVALGGVAVLGTGGTVGYGVYVYSQPNTIGNELNKRGKRVLDPDSSINNVNNLWRLLTIRHSKESTSDNKFTGFESSLTSDNISTQVNKLKSECKKAIEETHSENSSDIKSKLDKAEKWCVDPNDVASQIILLGSEPITLKLDSELASLWKVFFNRYFLEIGNTEEIIGAGNNTNREASTTTKETAFKTGCESLLKKTNPKSNDLNKAKKWCSVYVTVAKEKSKDKSKLKEDTDTTWKTNYDALSGDLKTLVDALKNNSDSEDAKSRKALKKWCEMTLDASSSYTFKDKISSCAFNT